ncbi:MAG: succinyl-CoA--3-ketoacid-CoA transferase [SAR202 cluster bacterium Io17-Chloro-G9]|nr:MAG: succinyl-CoA--3-ketoacid-CoA transferase [SAR202 cluster bacterium Io17-Chloro-G9]
MEEKERLDREIIAMRVAKELPDGGYVNLGIGIPTLVSSFVPEGKAVFYHSESGVLNCGPLAEEAEEDIDLINAGGQFLQPVPGMSFFSSADAFAMIRGGHVDVTVLGAHQVSANGDLANWMLPQRGVGNVGGAMDLCLGAKTVIVAMEHTDRQNQPKIVEQCTLPLTGRGCVSLIVTDLAVIERSGEVLTLKEVAPGWTPQEVQSLTGAQLVLAADLKEYQL